MCGEAAAARSAAGSTEAVLEGQIAIGEGGDETCDKPARPADHVIGKRVSSGERCYQL